MTRLAAFSLMLHGLVFLAVYIWMLATLRRNEELRSAHRYVYSDAA
jgi:hypothetical protein